MTNSGPLHLPYGRQDLDEDDIAAVVSALKSDWLTGGPVVEGFERALADTVGAPHAIACSSGTAALHMAAMALDLGPGDRVVVPALTFAATANAARFVGAEVTFCDVDSTTGLATAETVAAALAHAGASAKAIFVVHLNGQAADMAGIGALAQAQDLALVEDACHALGGTKQDVNGAPAKIGSGVDDSLTAFSFHPVKTITSGEGGAVTCSSAAMADRIKRLRSHGITRDTAAFSMTDQAFDAGGDVNPWYYEMTELGYNYRICDIQCALGLSQLRRLSQFVERRAALTAHYDRLLAPLAPLVKPIHRNGYGQPAWHLYPILIDFENVGRSRASLMAALRSKGVGTQVHYLPVNRQPYYVDRYGASSLPGANAYYARCLSLPLYPAMGEPEVHRVVDGLRSIMTLE